jgi:hypothetical protein
LFNIPAQSVHGALEQFSAVTGSAVMYDSRLAANVRTNAVVGLYTPEVALRLILDGTDLAIRYTSPRDFMLVSAVQARAEEAADRAALVTGGQSDSTTLVLDTLYVDVIPGSENRPDFTAYSRAVRSELKRTLTRDPNTTNRIYEVQLDIWVDHRGQLRHPRVVRSKASSGVVDSICRVVAATVLKNAPPKGMPQPVRVTIIAI